MTNKTIQRVSTRNMSREEWLAERRKSIGGSDAAAVVGLSKWATPYTVYLDKTGALPEKEDNEALRQGRDLEDYVARRWMESTGKTVRRDNSIIRSSEYPFAHADVDRLVIGERAGLECKTTSTLDVRQFHGIDFPEKYYVQCVHYLAVTGLDRWYLAVLVLGREFHTFTLERNQAEIDALMSMEREFWKRVETNSPPPVGGTKADSDAVKAVFTDDDGETVDLLDRESAIDEYMALKGQRDALDARIAEIENNIKADMGKASGANCGRYRVSWKTQSRNNFQAKEFAADHPDVDLAPYYKPSLSRPFKITKLNKEDS